ncbi:complement C1q subcomponent subunit A [Astyanax mexicanus]|uniref:Complement C1q A chain n=1 Tax=Astyanax mexicanus TaxID=7994 RepID=A0A8B9KG51_ASTMX|nr:complement C1q subcomponent subunit A [Astyanax mexicanus]
MQLAGHLFAAVWVAGLFSFSLCQDDCKRLDGKPGKPGNPGRDGSPGEKGEKGDPAPQVHLSEEEMVALKGEQGEQGHRGQMGLQGFEGLLGPEGPAGPAGPDGVTAANSGDVNSGASKVAFSVVRTDKQIITYNTPVIFDKAITNEHNDFHTNSGRFTCSVAGVYYFVFHFVSEVNLCLKLKTDTNPVVDLTFCDFNLQRRSQVLSGGAVLKLAKGNRVWIERVNPHNMPLKGFEKITMKSEMSLVFSGFLIFSTD